MFKRISNKIKRVSRQKAIYMKGKYEFNIFFLVVVPCPPPSPPQPMKIILVLHVPTLVLQDCNNTCNNYYACKFCLSENYKWQEQEISRLAAFKNSDYKVTGLL